MEVNSSYALKPIAAKGRTLKQVNALYTRALKHEKKRQNNALKTNKNTPLKRSSKSQHSNADARHFTIDTPLLPGALEEYNCDEMTKSEVSRVLKAWDSKLKIAKWLEANGWETSYDDRPSHLKYTKLQLWLNVQRSGKLPAHPQVEQARLVLSKTNAQHTDHVTQLHRQLFLRTTILNHYVELEFEIPQKVYDQYKGWKTCRPTVYFDENNEVVFDFAFQKEITPEKPQGKSVLSADIGMERPYAASRTWADGSFELLGAHSLEIERIRKKKAKLYIELDRVTEKLDKHEEHDYWNENLIIQETLIRNKIKRLNVDEDWQVANDLAALVEPGEELILEKLNWGTGGVVKFRHGSVTAKSDHVASKKAIPTRKVNAKDSSKTCPVCHKPVEPNEDRITDCSNCEWIADRDDTASVIHGQSALKTGKTPAKGRMTPKRSKMKPRPRSTWPINRKPFTGGSPANAELGPDPLTSTATVTDRGPNYLKIQARWKKRLTPAPRSKIAKISTT